MKMNSSSITVHWGGTGSLIFGIPSQRCVLWRNSSLDELMRHSVWLGIALHSSFPSSAASELVIASSACSDLRSITSMLVSSYRNNKKCQNSALIRLMLNKRALSWKFFQSKDRQNSGNREHGNEHRDSADAPGTLFPLLYVDLLHSLLRELL